MTSVIVPPEPGLILVPESGWRLVAGWKRCRRRLSGMPVTGCANDAVAELNRAYGNRPRWWAYCEEHMYGRVVREGVVWAWANPDSPRGRAWRLVAHLALSKINKLEEVKHGN